MLPVKNQSFYCAMLLVGLISFSGLPLAQEQQSTPAIDAREDQIPTVKPGPPSGGWSTNTSPVDRFKAFLSNPPVIESLVFSERLPPDPKNPSRTDIPLRTSRAFRYWQARWQPAAFFLRELPRPDGLADLNTRGLLAVRFNDQCWFHYGRGYNDRWLDFGVSSAQRTNDVCAGAFNNAAVLRQVLNMGLMNSGVGSVEWLGNRFRVRSPAREERITGELVALGAGLADSLRVKYSSENLGDIHWLIRYAYATNHPASGLPSLISCFWLNGKQEVQRDEFEIHELKTRTFPLELSAFAPDQLLASNTWQLRLLTNNAIYALLPDGKLMLLDYFRTPPRQSRRAGKPAPSESAILYSVWAGANVWILVLALRMSRKLKQKPQKTL